MAEIQIMYRKYCCDLNPSEIDTVCFCDYAQDKGCPFYQGEERQPGYVPFGSCQRAQIKFGRKGWVGKRYEMEEVEVPYIHGFDYMRVRLGNTDYTCEKVVLDGECIYNTFDNEEGKDA